MERTRMCVVCAAPIDAERAGALPQTNLCVVHGEEIKAYGNEFRVVAEEENLSKQNSLKRNPGGVATRMVRNVEAIQQLRDDYREQHG